MMQFPIQNNPSKIDQGINKGFDFYTKLLQSLAMPEMMKTQQEQNNANLLKTQLTNQYYPQATESDIAYKGALGQEAEERKKLLPIDNLIKQQQTFNEAGRLSQSQNRFTSTLSVLQKFLSSDIGKNLYANDREFANAATNLMRGVATEPDLSVLNQKLPMSNPQSNYSGNLQKNLIPSFSEVIGFPFQKENSEQIQQNRMAVPGGVAPKLQQAVPMGIENEKNNIEPIKSENKYFSPSTDIVNESLKNADSQVVTEVQNKLKDMMEKKSTTTAVLNQRQYANIFNSLFEEAKEALPAIYEYSGIQGHSKLLRDKLLATIGITSPNLILYNTFQKVTKPTMAAELRRKLGGQATDQEINKMLNVVDPSTSWFGNKELAKGEYSGLEKASRAADIALGKGSSEVKESLQKPVEYTKQKFETKTENGKVMVQGPNGKWYPADEL